MSYELRLFRVFKESTAYALEEGEVYYRVQDDKILSLGKLLSKTVEMVSDKRFDWHDGDMYKITLMFENTNIVTIGYVYQNGGFIHQSKINEYFNYETNTFLPKYTIVAPDPSYM